MLKRYLTIGYLILGFLLLGPSFALADDLSEGLELYRAKKYQEAIPYLERAANDGHEKAIETLDQIYKNEPKLPKSQDNDKNHQNSDKASNESTDRSIEVSNTIDDTHAKNNFQRKIIAIAIAIGIIAAWFIHRRILRKKHNKK